jgi:membrane associated rhomboid family serine protease
MSEPTTRRQGRGQHVDWGRRVADDTRRADRLLWVLLGINIAVFVLWQFARNDGLLVTLMSMHFTVSVESVLSLRLWTLLTTNFSHYDATHLLFNCIALYIFGRDVGRALGFNTLLNLYLVGGVASAVGHVVYGLVTGDPTPALGASGSVMALAVMYGALFPNRTLLLNFFIPVPAGVAVGLFIAMDVFGVFGVGGGTIAHAAHLGGAAWGLAWWWFRVRR